MLACSLVTRTCLNYKRFDFWHVQTADSGDTKPWKNNCSLIWKLFKCLMTLLAGLFEMRGCWHIGLRWAIVALWATCFLFVCLKSGLGPSPCRRQNSEYPLSVCRDTDHSAVIFLRKTNPKSGKDPIWYIITVTPARGTFLRKTLLSRLENDKVRDL